jgi:alpha-N-arabinofuranosidase
MDKAINSQIISDSGNFTGPASISTINSTDVNAGFTFENRDSYVPATSSVKTKGNILNYSFPAHSFTQIIVGVE